MGLVLSGAVVSGWPVGETLVGDARDSSETTSYVNSVRDTPAEVLSEELELARQYNADLPANSLRDPWDGSSAAATAAHDRYLKTLDASLALGRIRIPAIGVDLQILHDADSLSMADGVGHMYGSSLPIGGAGTHAVLAAHTGFRGRTRFDRLPELKINDTFQVSVARQTLTYRVDQIDIVEPSNLAAVQRVAGKDYVTLVTCTPPGTHRQRLLVRGIRVPDPEGSTTTTTTTTTSANYEDAPVTQSLVIAAWAWPRLLGVAVALAVALGMVIAWVVSDRRVRARAHGGSRGYPAAPNSGSGGERS